jgi:DNA-binding transcriptional MerR regulator
MDAMERPMQHIPAPVADPEVKSAYTIGDLAREFGLTLRTLRFYEDKQLITPRRRGLTRLYSRRDRARLKLVLLGKKVGFSLAEIAEVLDLYDLKDGQVIQLQVALAKFGKQIEVLRQQREDIEQGIQELTRTMDVVSGMLRDRERGEAAEFAREAAE